LKKSKGRLLLKIIVWTISVVALLVILGLVLVNYCFIPHLKERISAKIYESSEGVYELNIDSLDANIFSGNIMVINIHLVTDESKRTSSHKKLLPRISLKAQAISINDIQWVHYLFSKHLRIGKIELKNPVLSYQDYKKGKEKDHKTAAEKLPSLLSSFCKSLRIHELLLEGGMLDFKENSEKGITRHEINKITITLNGVHVVSSSDKPLYADQLTFSIKDYKVLFPLYSSNLHIHTIHGSTKDQNLILNGVSFESRPKHISHDIPQYRINIHSVKIHKVNYRKLLHLKEVNIHKCELHKVKMDIYENSNLPPLKEKKPFPYQIFHELIPVAFNIDTLSVRNSNFLYRVILPEANEPIEVAFSGTQIKITDLSNHKHSKQITKIYGNCDLFGSVPLEVHMEIDLNDQNINFQYYGELKEMNLEVLNPIITKTTPAEIKRGTIHTGSFNFTVTNGTTNGTLSANYENLKIELKSPVTGRKLRLLNTLSNQRIINKSKENTIKNVQYTHQEKNESFFLFLVRPIIAGAVKIVLKGVENKKVVEKITHPKSKK